MAPLSLLHACFVLCLVGTLAGAQVPTSQTFSFSVWGPLETQKAEYEATYRQVTSGAHTFYTHPFRLCFYNTTADSAVLAIAAGVPNELSPVRFVWEANRNRPVRDTAVLSFRRDGNLVLSGHDGFPVWETGTAGKGVVGVKLLPNGNFVLHDKNGRFIWQSFDHPTDTLLVEQSLKLNGPNRLVSRLTETNSSDGPYAIVLNKDGFTTYINKSRESLPYGGWRGSYIGSMITFKAVAEYDTKTASELVIAVNQSLTGTRNNNNRRLLQIPPTVDEDHIVLNKLSYDASISFFRIGHDGNLRVFTYNDAVSSLRWRESFAYFSNYYLSECQLPTHCGEYGMCERAMCVACPTPRGMTGWDEGCVPPRVPPCGGAGNKTVEYYKIVGVGHFLSPFWREDEDTARRHPVSVGECRERCNKDCKCVGFMYNEEVSTCMTVPMLGSLLKINDSTSVGYIKYSI